MMSKIKNIDEGAKKAVDEGAKASSVDEEEEKAPKNWARQNLVIPFPLTGIGSLITTHKKVLPYSDRVHSADCIAISNTT
jgi:hypothetical protein